MKQVIAVMLLFCFYTIAGAQNIKKMEYFFDTDPGTGKATPLTITAADTVNITTDIPVNNLTKGQHALYIRAKTDTGWGHSECVLFTVSDALIATPVAKEEYFFDNDPGTGIAITMPIITADTMVLEQTISAGSLTEGLHTLYLRVANNGGYYSHTESSLFYVTSFATNSAGITGAEYFIDTDPGTGKGKKLVTGTLTDTLKRTYNLTPPTGLEAGIDHYICIRVKDEKGIWSLYGLDTFRVSANFKSISINAKKDGNKAAVEWITDNSNAITYTVEKSANGIDFTPLYDISSKGLSQTYHINDLTPVNGLNFYRIKESNSTGDINYSNIAKVLFDIADKPGITLYPNPVKDVLNISLNTKSAKGKTVFINIFDASGGWIKLYNVVADTNIQINVSDLARGSYIIHVSNGEKTFTGKMIKQ